MTEIQLHIGAKSLGEIGANVKPITTYEKGRKCSECGMKLSMYNPETKCQICLPVRGVR